MLKRRNGGALRVDEAFLLRGIERRGGARLQPLLDQIEHAGGTCQIVARNTQAVLRRKHLEIGIGGSDYGGKADNFAVVAAGDRALLGRA